MESVLVDFVIIMMFSGGDSGPTEKLKSRVIGKHGPATNRKHLTQDIDLANLWCH